VSFFSAVRGAYISEEDDRLAIQMGSRNAYRIWGLFAGRKRMPLTIVVSSQHEGDMTIATAEFSSNEGGYVTRIPRATEMYMAVFDDLATQIATLASR
jgi:hypothetical protein